MASHYDFAILKRGLVHFLTGKALTAVSSIAAILLLARALPKPDYAALIVFEAMISLTGIALSFGISQPVLLRYIPELRVQNNGLALYGLIRRSLLSRTWIFALACLLLALLAPWFGRWFGFEAKSNLFPLYLLAGWACLMLQPILASMESLLWQKTSQYIVAFTAAARLALLSLGYVNGTLDLHAVVLIEIAYQTMTLLLLIAGLWFNQRQDPHRHEGDPDWFATNRQRIARYARASYGFSLSSLLTGSQPNRAVAGRFLPPNAIGDYGFADSLTGIFRRFLPSTLLQGFIRPFYFARYSETSQSSHVERLGNLILRVNLVLMAQVSLVLLMFGKPLVDGLTAGKYGDTVYLVVAMLGLLVLSSLLNQYILLCQTLEKNNLLIYSNLICSASILLSFPLFPAMGAWAIVVANVSGLVAATVFIHFWLARAGTLMKLDFALIFRVIFSFAVSLSCGLALQDHYSLAIAGVSALAVSGLLSLLWRPFTAEDVAIFRRLMARRLASST